MKKRHQEKEHENFTLEKWREKLAKKDWNEVLSCDDLDGKVELFNLAIKEALDEIAPVKSFFIYIFFNVGDP